VVPTVAPSPAASVGGVGAGYGAPQATLEKGGGGRRLVHARGLLVLGLDLLGAALLLSLLAAVAAGLGGGTWGWSSAQAHFIRFSFLLPVLLALHVAIAGPYFARAPSSSRIGLAVAAYIAGGIVVAAAQLVAGALARGLLILGYLVVTAGAVLQTIAIMPCLPKESLVRAEDPITKGDDACFKHITFAHRFLPLAMLLTTFAVVAQVTAGSAWAMRGVLAASHMLLIGYALLTLYGTTQLLVPRLAQRPPVAAGAIKGQLHSSLPGILLIPIGLLLGYEDGWGRGLLLAGGSFLFIGAFTYMGVLGANIMRNKSRTQRITPEYSHLPWVFSGVLWILCGLLMGWFLPAASAQIPAYLAAARHAHVMLLFVGGVAQMLIGLAPRILESDPRKARAFQGIPRWSFLLFNGGMITSIVGHANAGPGGPGAVVGAAMLVIAVLLMRLTVEKAKSPQPVASA
jgi:hypothetical protein